jgi:hypothetical protein
VFSASGRHKQGGPDRSRDLFLFDRQPRIPSASKSAVVVPSGYSTLSRCSFSSRSIFSIFLVQMQPIRSRLGFTPQESDRMQPAAEYGRR